MTKTSSNESGVLSSYPTPRLKIRMLGNTMDKERKGLLPLIFDSGKDHAWLSQIVGLHFQAT